MVLGITPNTKFVYSLNSRSNSGNFRLFLYFEKKFKYEEKTVIMITWENTLRDFQSMVLGGG